jgi:hypothetical protein
MLKGLNLARFDCEAFPFAPKATQTNRFERTNLESHSTNVLETALHKITLSVWFRSGFGNVRSVLKCEFSQRSEHNRAENDIGVKTLTAQLRAMRLHPIRML